MPLEDVHIFFRLLADSPSTHHSMGNRLPQFTDLLHICLPINSGDAKVQLALVVLFEAT